MTDYATTSASQKGLTINRTFSAPKEAVFDAFANADALAQWWGPVGMKTTVLHFDFRPGGRFHYKMEAAGQTMWGLFVYGDIQRPDLLEFTNSFSDEAGAISSSPFPMDFPLEVFNRVTFREEGGMTTITLQGHPVRATEAQLATYYSILENMEQGFGATMEQLADYLAR